jgi:2'-5' RNA ligase
VRTFLAIDIDEHIRKGLAEVGDLLAAQDARIICVAAENLHITLNFLGEVKDERIADVCRIAADVAATIEPFDFDVQGVLPVPPRGQLRMIWVGVRDTTGRMALLQKTLAAAFEGLGLKEEERTFRPHITLGRVKFARNPDAVRSAIAPQGDEDFGACRADEVIVFSSTLSPKGSIYTPLARARLG